MRSGPGPRPISKGVEESVAWDALCEDSGCRVVLMDSCGVVIGVNPRAEESFRLPAERVLGREMVELYPAGLRARAAAWLRDVGGTEPGRPLTGEYVAHGCHWVAAGRPVPMDDGTTGVLCVSRIAIEPAPTSVLLREIELAGDRAESLGALAVLTDRELEVAMLIGAGMSDSEVAAALHRSERTVHAHRRSIGRKLRVRRRFDLVELMTRRGMVARTG